MLLLLLPGGTVVAVFLSKKREWPTDTCLPRLWYHLVGCAHRGTRGPLSLFHPVEKNLHVAQYIVQCGQCRQNSLHGQTNRYKATEPIRNHTIGAPEYSSCEDTGTRASPGTNYSTGPGPTDPDTSHPITIQHSVYRTPVAAYNKPRDRV